MAEPWSLASTEPSDAFTVTPPVAVALTFTFIRPESWPIRALCWFWAPVASPPETVAWEMVLFSLLIWESRLFAFPTSVAIWPSAWVPSWPRLAPIDWEELRNWPTWLTAAAFAVAEGLEDRVEKAEKTLSSWPKKEEGLDGSPNRLWAWSSIDEVTEALELSAVALRLACSRNRLVVRAMSWTPTPIPWPPTLSEPWLTTSRT